MNLKTGTVVSEGEDGKAFIIGDYLLPRTIGSLMMSATEVSSILSRIVELTKTFRDWKERGEFGSKQRLREMIPTAFKELFTFSSTMGFLLASVIHEKMRENKAKYMAELYQLNKEHFDPIPNQTEEGESDRDKKKRRWSEGNRVMEKYLIHGVHLNFHRTVTFSEDVSHWDMRYKQLNFRSLVHQDFTYKLDHLYSEIAGFARDRGWLGTYTPKRICMSLIAEMGELAANLEWRREEDTVMSLPREVKVDIARETADVAIYLLHLARELEMRASDVNALL